LHSRKARSATVAPVLNADQFRCNVAATAGRNVPADGGPPSRGVGAAAHSFCQLDGTGSGRQHQHRV